MTCFIFYKLILHEYFCGIGKPLSHKQGESSGEWRWQADLHSPLMHFPSSSHSLPSLRIVGSGQVLLTPLKVLFYFGSMIWQFQLAKGSISAYVRISCLTYLVYWSNLAIICAAFKIVWWTMWDLSKCALTSATTILKKYTSFFKNRQNFKNYKLPITGCIYFASNITFLTCIGIFDNMNEI